MPPVVKKIALNNLLLLEENPRTENLKNQEETISNLVTDYGDKIYKLATDIKEYSIIESIAVLEHDNSFIVYEEIDVF